MQKRRTFSAGFRRLRAGLSLIKEGGNLGSGFLAVDPMMLSLVQFWRRYSPRLFGTTGLGFATFIVVFAFVAVYVASTNTHGDGLARLTEAAHIADTGSLLDYRPHLIMNLAQGTPEPYPNTYPAIPQISMATLYLFGNETLLRLYAPLMAASTALFVYLTFASFYQRAIGVTAAALVILLNMQRFVMVPLIEQMLLMEESAAIYFYVSWLRTRRRQYLLLAGIFIGLAVSTKLQGWILLAAITIHALLYVGWQLVRSWRHTLLPRFNALAAIAGSWRHTSLPSFIALAVIVALVAALPLAEQISRNGTILNVPTSQSPPFLQSHYPLDQAAFDAQNDRLGYVPPASSWADVVYRSLLYPFYYESTPSFTTSGAQRPLVLLAGVGTLLLAGLYVIFRRTPVLGLFLAVLLLTYWTEVTAYGPSRNFYQYHNLLLLTLGVVIATGFIVALRAARHLPNGPLVTTLVAICTVALVGGAFFTHSHERLYAHSGRQTDVALKEWNELCQFIDVTIDPHEPILSPSQNLRTNCKRDTYWINEGGGLEVIEAVEASDPRKSYEILNQIGIKYIVFDKRQTQRRGLSDYAPLGGLFTTIQRSPLFEPLYVVEDKLFLYRLRDDQTSENQPRQ